MPVKSAIVRDTTNIRSCRDPRIPCARMPFTVRSNAAAQALEEGWRDGDWVKCRRSAGALGHRVNGGPQVGQPTRGMTDRTVTMASGATDPEQPSGDNHQRAV
ncbi:hypothetical protein GCM10010171_62870 [Actinokineospora fastidiosa]|uniref:Uncharacterized protein n=1 Tax=Actinokineospora fastidiosa TaxID=1816 RepID=A0A918GSP5_9PSEU|nr:hypothetical protein GCM10010171_62870 [Actinokineospora fastidiosa]